MSATGQQNEQASEPQLCATGCGFFANMGCGGMCSKCHREHLADLERKLGKAAPATTSAASPSVQQPSTDLSSASPAAPRPAAEPAVPPALSPAAAVEQASTSGAGAEEGGACKPANRCAACKKKVGLTGFKCKCGDLFCGQHRYAESHSCPFDYKGAQRQKLAESNPLVQASKVQKI